MTPASNRAVELFEQALQINPGPGRTAFLNRACDGDPALLEQVQRLLVTHRAPSSSGAPDGTTAFGPPTGSGALDDALFGEWVGPYRLIEKLGEGGMGIVYLAEQETPIRRRVAVKVIKIGMDTQQVVARFEAERQALALMDHPGIARILDGGTTPAGRPYFVMELISGDPVTRFCDQARLPIKQRVELVIDICSAIQHAHQKGIIHRDLKPSNILVAQQGERAVSKVIDFGIAKATQQRLTDRTLVTIAAQVIGTPAYMSPEQANSAKMDVDTRSDIYSLGVLLYELLAGTTPFDAKALVRNDYEEMRRQICETDPPRPSTRFLALSAGERSSVAIHRSTEVTPLANLLKGDLDWIVTKCLEKDRGRRYETASGLAMDLRRFLGSEPVLARPPSALYRAGKAARRHRNALAATIIVLIGLLGATVFSTGQALKARRAQRALEAQVYVAKLGQAEAAVASGDIQQARKLLEECPAPGRGWEWRYLRSLEDRSLASVAFPAIAWSVAWHPRKDQLAVVTKDGRIQLRNATNLEEALETQIPIPSVRGLLSVAFDASGDRVFAGGADGRVLVWNPENPGPPVEIGSHSDLMPATPNSPMFEIWEIANNPANPNQVATITRAGIVRLWDVERASRVPLWSNDTRETGLFGIAISPDGKFVATGGEGREIRIWSAIDGRSVAVLTGHKEAVNSLAFSPNGRELVSASDDKSIRFWDVGTWQLKDVLSEHHSWVRRIAFSRDGELLASASRDRTVRIWNVRERRAIAVLTGHNDYVRGLAFAPSGDRLATTGEDLTLRTWMASSGAATALATLDYRRGLELGGQNRLSSAAFSPGGRRLWAGCSDGVIREFLYPSGKPSRSFAHSFFPTPVRLCLSVDGRILVASDDFESHVSVWDTDRGVLIREFEGSLADIDSDSSTVVLRDAQGRLAAHDVQSGKVRWNEEAARAPYTCIRTRPHQPAFAVATMEGEVQMRRFGDGRLVRAWQPHIGSVRSIVFSPDGKLLLSVGSDQRIAVSFSDSGRIVWAGTNALPMLAAAFHPDGTRFAISEEGHDGRVRIFRSENPLELGVLAPGGFGWFGEAAHFLHAVDLAFSPDGNALLAALEPGVLRLWDSSPEPRALAERDLLWRAAALLERAEGDKESLKPLEQRLEVLAGDDRLLLETARQLQGNLNPPINYLAVAATFARARVLARSGQTREAAEQIGTLMKRARETWRDRDVAVYLETLSRAVFEYAEAGDGQKAIAACVEGVAACVGERNRSGPWAPLLARRFSRKFHSLGGPVGALAEWSPARPAAAGLPDFVGPAGGATLFRTSEFVPPRTGGDHQSTRWEVRFADAPSGAELVFVSEDRIQLTELTMPGGVLEPSRTYQWRASHESVGVFSDFGPWESFTTRPYPFQVQQLDLSAHFNVDGVADPDDAQNDDLDGYGGLYVTEGFDGVHTDEAAVRGLPANGRVGPHQLGSYSGKNVLQMLPAATAEIRITIPPARYSALRWLLSSSSGANSTPARLEYADGTSESVQIVSNDWTASEWEDAPAGVIPRLRGINATVGGNQGATVPAALYEWLTPVRRDSDLVAVVLKSPDKRPSRPESRLNLFSVIGVRAD